MCFEHDENFNFSNCKITNPCHDSILWNKEKKKSPGFASLSLCSLLLCRLTSNCSALCLLSVFRSSFLIAITLYPEHTSTLVERGKKGLHSTAELFCRRTLWYLKTTDQPSALTYYKYCQRELINSSVKWCYTGHFFTVLTTDNSILLF